MHRGYIKAWRKEYDSAIWNKPPLYLKVWRWLLYRCDRTNGKWEGALSQIADGCQWEDNNAVRIPARETIRRILEWLNGAGMIKTEASDRRGTTVSIVKWHLYQGEMDRLVTPKRHRKDTEKTSTRSKKKLEEGTPVLSPNGESSAKRKWTKDDYAVVADATKVTFGLYAPAGTMETMGGQLTRYGGPGPIVKALEFLRGDTTDHGGEVRVRGTAAFFRFFLEEYVNKANGKGGAPKPLAHPTKWDEGIVHYDGSDGKV